MQTSIPLFPPLWLWFSAIVYRGCSLRLYKFIYWESSSLRNSVGIWKWKLKLELFEEDSLRNTRNYPHLFSLGTNSWRLSHNASCQWYLMATNNHLITKLHTYFLISGNKRHRLDFLKVKKLINFCICGFNFPSALKNVLRFWHCTVIATVWTLFWVRTISFTCFEILLGNLGALKLN